jgi:DNA-binding NtrC family response regulator
MTPDGPFRVLVVEDESLMRWSVAQALTGRGHTVVEAADGAAAMRLLEETPADVVLLDYQLPDSDDFALLRDIRRLAPATPVVLMTAFGTPELSDRARALGASDVLQKPFDVFRVDGVLRRACGSSVH